MIIKRLVIVCFIIASMVVNLHALPADAAETAPDAEATDAAPPPDSNSENVDGLIARMSDEQMRRMLIEELRKSADPTADKESSKLAQTFQNIQNNTSTGSERLIQLLAHFPQLPKEIGQALHQISDQRGIAHLLLVVLFVALNLAFSFGVELLFTRFLAPMRKQLESSPAGKGGVKVWSAFLRQLPEFIGIAIFAVVSLIVFGLLCYLFGRPFRLVYLAAWLAIIIPRMVSAIFKLFFAPKAPELRLLPFDDNSAQFIHNRFMIFVWFLSIGFIVALLLKMGQLSDQGYTLIIFLITTVATILVVSTIWQRRKPVAESIAAANRGDSPAKRRLKQHLAGIWHVLAIAYLAGAWFLWSIRTVTVGLRFDGSFVLSVLIIPIYFIFDRIAQWLIISSKSVVGQITTAMDSETSTTEDDEETPSSEPIDPNERYQSVALLIARIVIALALVLWLFDVWNVPIPYARQVARAVFDVIVVLVLVHIIWQITLNTIDRKLMDGLPDEQADGHGGDEGFGGIVQTRKQTILPLIRKFIGTVLVVMAVMIILSAMGVNIGPLLAGAGVIGLAIGFGAQKLVSDVLTGLFFMIDDSFRVGEYLESGALTGHVEEIGLRTIKLRHYKGMIQIIPYSELGTITNHNRGDIVTKFSIELPYGTNIDKVRKIIKKVGKELLKHEELGPTFVAPLKSQGVKRVGNSVMEFRVKFTAKPGAHFLIRREAFRAITEALDKNGIGYAHRKVIVDVAPTDESETDNNQTPKPTAPASPSTDQNKTAVEAGAGAAIAAIEAEEKKS